MGSQCVWIARPSFNEGSTNWYWRVPLSANPKAGDTTWKHQCSSNFMWGRSYSRSQQRRKTVLLGWRRLRPAWTSRYQSDAKRWRWMSLSAKAKADSGIEESEGQGDCLWQGSYSCSDHKRQPIFMGRRSMRAVRSSRHELISVRWRRIPFPAHPSICSCLEKRLCNSCILWRCSYHGAHL